MGCCKGKEENAESVMKQMENLRTALIMLCESFLVRAKDCDKDPLWHSFYTIQMSSYLCGKRNLEVTPPEGDMVHDLIREVWDEDVKLYMKNSKFGPVSNVEQWFKTIRIDFPLDPFDPDCSFFNGFVFPVCQNDTEKSRVGKTV